jgi:peptidylglycine monooxygenase
VRTELVVALGQQRYRVERPFGVLPGGAGRVTDVVVDAAERVHVLLRYDPLVDAPGPRVITLDAEGRQLAAWGGELIADSHMVSVDAANRLFIVDRDAHEVIICDTNGQRVGGLGTRNRPRAPFNHPTHLAVCPRGTI